jgi:hypothetical protein
VFRLQTLRRCLPFELRTVQGNSESACYWNLNFKGVVVYFIIFITLCDMESKGTFWFVSISGETTVLADRVIVVHCWFVWI